MNALHLAARWYATSTLCLLWLASVSALDNASEARLVRMQKQLRQQRQAVFGPTQTNAIVGRCIPAPPPSNAFGNDGLAWDGQHLWVASNSDGITEPGRIWQLDPQDGRVLHSFAAPGPGTHDLTFDGQHLWNVDFLDDRLYQIDRTDGSVIRSIPAPEGISYGLTWDGSTLWVSESLRSRALLQVDPRDGSVLQTFRPPNLDPALSTLAWDGAHLWFGSPFDDGVFKLDPDDGDVFAFVPYNVMDRGLTYDGTVFWADTVPSEICQLTLDTSPGQSLTILPPRANWSSHSSLTWCCLSKGKGSRWLISGRLSIPPRHQPTSPPVSCAARCRRGRGSPCGVPTGRPPPLELAPIRSACRWS